MGPGDARRLSPESLEDLRRRAVAAVGGGMSQSEAARALGVSRRAVGVWVRAHRVAGEAALRPNRRGRAPGDQYALAASQQARLLRIMVSGPPDALRLEHPLWSRRAVAALVEQELGLVLSPVTMGHYLSRWGLVVPPVPALAFPGVLGTPEGTRRRGEAMWAAWVRVAPQEPAPAGAGAPAAPGRLELLMARSSRGSSAFLLSRTPYGVAEALDFGDRLLRHAGGGVHLTVRAWPADRLTVLRGWRDALPPEVPLRVSVF